MKAILLKDIPEFDLKDGQVVEVKEYIEGKMNLTEKFGWYTVECDNNPDRRPIAKKEHLQFIHE